MRNILLTSITLIAFAFLGNAQNCPTYSPTVTATGEACGGQDYLITIENNGCNSEIYFDYLGTLGYNANPGDMEIVSIQTGAAFVTHSGTGSFNGIIGPIDPSIHGTAFNLIVTNGSFTVSQSGNTVAQNSNYTINPVDEMFYFAITISSATLTVTLPSGAGSIVKNIDNCKDFNVQIPLSNTNFCTTLNV